jgi:hypothetical protein
MRPRVPQLWRRPLSLGEAPVPAHQNVPSIVNHKRERDDQPQEPACLKQAQRRACGDQIGPVARGLA